MYEISIRLRNTPKDEYQERLRELTTFAGLEGHTQARYFSDDHGDAIVILGVDDTHHAAFLKLKTSIEGNQHSGVILEPSFGSVSGDDHFDEDLEAVSCPGKTLRM